MKQSIAININSAKALNSVVGHEITHVLEGTELYAPMQKLLFDYAKTKGEYDSRLKAITELYREHDPDANPIQELTADLVGDYLFSDTDFIRKVSTEDRGLFQKLWDEVKYLCKVVCGFYTKRYINTIQVWQALESHGNRQS